jgi:signal transduction histidine kinase
MRATLQVRLRDGTLIWVDHHADCIGRAGDDFTVQGTVIDVTARHEVAQAQELSRAARAESEAKSKFLAAMSHELRTPLNSVLGFAQLLEAQPGVRVDKRQARYVANIQSSGEHLLAIINDILDLSKVAAGRVEMANEAVDALAAVQEAVTKMTPMSDQKGLMVSVTAVSEDLTLWADRLRLHQILLNLLSNAVKFTDVGSITITCEIENGVGAIRVSDSGAGIPARSLNSVFDEFTQVGSAGQSHGGTGLGLPLSRRLAQAMGGDVTVASRLGRGSTFTLSLPLYSIEQEPGSNPVPMEPV